MYRLASILLLVSTVSCQQLMQGQCATVQYQQGLNLTAVLGTWYEAKRINNTVERGECTTLTFTGVMANGDLASVHLDITEVIDGQVAKYNGTVTVGADYKFTVTLTGGIEVRFGVLKTDYTNYAVLHSCDNVANGKAVVGWILTRTKTVSSQVTGNYESAIKGNDDLVNATWIQPSFSDAACKNGANTWNTSPIAALLMIGLILLKQI